MAPLRRQQQQKHQRKVQIIRWGVELTGTKLKDIARLRETL